MIINEVLWIIFTYSSLIGWDDNLERVIFPKPSNLGKMHSNNYPWSVLQKCLYLVNDALWKLNTGNLLGDVSKI